MASQSGSHVYLFGFNGFKQIDKVKPEASVSLPQKCTIGCGVGAVKCVFTWSQIWILAGSSKADMWGFKREEVANLCSKGDIVPKTAIPQGQHTLLQTSKGDNQNLHLLCDDGNIVDVTCTPENVTIADAMNKKVLATKDGYLYEGQIEVADVRADLKLRSLDMTIKVTSVSCGYDHTLILSSSGEVYSCGSSSRGQLGLGESFVDIVHTPVAVKTLEGIRTVTIAAGGWHSTSVSEYGDLYVWGWNESGQLGLPNGNDTSDKEETVSSSLAEKLNAEESLKNSTAFHSGQDFEKESRTDTADQGLETGVPLSIIQNTDSVQIQSVPYGLDIPDEMCVKDVACGSRHTCILLDSGYVMTTGWNKYGQLGHGDTVTTDYLRTVTYFVERKQTVTNIFAGYWNTGVITNPAV